MPHDTQAAKRSVARRADIQSSVPVTHQEAGASWISGPGRPERARDWPYPILWAPVPFVEDSTASKIRPVVMLDSDDKELTALALFRKSHISNTTYSMQIDRESAASFDRRARYSYIEVTRVIHISWDQIPDNLGRVGALSHADQRRLEAALREWEVHL